MITDDMNECIEMMNRLTGDLFGKGDVKFYGYTQYCGPDGIPHVREFGNVATKIPSDGIREPLADVSAEGDTVRAVFEIPGVDKKDIKLECTQDSIGISVDTESRKYQKTLRLPKEVDVDSASAGYNNGILEVTLRSKEQKAIRRQIEIN